VTVSREGTHLGADFAPEGRLPQDDVITPTSSGPPGGDPGLRPAEGQSLPGEAVEMRDESVDLGRLERRRPTLAQ
jgi:hypothetical protein